MDPSGPQRQDEFKGLTLPWGRGQKVSCSPARGFVGMAPQTSAFATCLAPALFTTDPAGSLSLPVAKLESAPCAAIYQRLSYDVLRSYQSPLITPRVDVAAIQEQCEELLTL